jgi:hypothetical protein
MENTKLFHKSCQGSAAQRLHRTHRGKMGEAFGLWWGLSLGSWGFTYDREARYAIKVLKVIGN